jgi:hypothetical protein
MPVLVIEPFIESFPKSLLESGKLLVDDSIWTGNLFWVEDVALQHLPYRVLYFHGLVHVLVSLMNQNNTQKMLSRKWSRFSWLCLVMLIWVNKASANLWKYSTLYGRCWRATSSTQKRFPVQIESSTRSLPDSSIDFGKDSMKGSITGAT